MKRCCKELTNEVLGTTGTLSAWLIAQFRLPVIYPWLHIKSRLENHKTACHHIDQHESEFFIKYTLECREGLVSSPQSRAKIQVSVGLDPRS